MNVPASTLLPDRGSADRALPWRTAISLATSIALHVLLFMLFLRTVAPAPPSGRFDVVTVYLRDSRRYSPPPAPKPQVDRASSQRADARPDIAEAPRPLGSKPIAPERALSSARDKPMPRKPARTIDMVSVAPARAADTPLAKPSPIDQQGNSARDSHAQYLRELAARLSQVKRYPQIAVALHEEGTVMLSFQIDREGHLLAWNIAASSGHDNLDSEVERMIALAAPFPPFPPSWRQSDEVFRVPIGFYMHK